MSKTKHYSIERKQARWGFLFTVPCLLFFAIFRGEAKEGFGIAGRDDSDVHSFL